MKKKLMRTRICQKCDSAFNTIQRYSKLCPNCKKKGMVGIERWIEYENGERVVAKK